jgi:ribosome-binding ATPase
LGLITFFTTGPDETRAWTIKQGTLVPQAAGVIHSDFEKKFICALVINWEKLLNKELPRTEGKEYIVLDGDVIEVKHG